MVSFCGAAQCFMFRLKQEIANKSRNRNTHKCGRARTRIRLIGVNVLSSLQSLRKSFSTTIRLYYALPLFLAYTNQ